MAEVLKRARAKVDVNFIADLNKHYVRKIVIELK